MMVSVRIVTADHYMCAPLPGLDVFYSDFRGSEVKQVPVIRIFGSTSIGKKVCLHIHGVFPYIYVPYDGCEPNEREAYKLSSSLDKALNVSLGKSNATTQHVYKISLVSGRPFYGYHAKEHQFFKIYLYNPIMVKRAADLLQSGAVLNKKFQPHEAHLSFMLQFFIDFNLYGMNFINFSKVKYRHPITVTETTVGLLKDISTGSVEIKGFEDIPEDLYLPESVARMSTCELELDALATAIMNRSATSESPTVIPGLAALWEEERERRLKHGLSSQFSPAPSQLRNDTIFTNSEFLYFERLCNQLRSYQHGSSPLTENMSHNELALDTSGYPSETPENMSVQDASLVEVHLPTPVQCIKNVTSNILNDQQLSPENDDKCHSSQNSVLLDTQDQMLMNAWEDMLEDKNEDSILSTQTQLHGNFGPNDFVEVLAQEEVEDNQLLEISQIFDWEEKTENEALKFLRKPIVNIETKDVIDEPLDENTIESPNADIKLQQPNAELNHSFSDKEKIQLTDEKGNHDISDWEDNFWDNENEDNFGIEPIAQLDGADDLMELDEKIKIQDIKDLPKHRQRLVISKRVTGPTSKEPLSKKRCALSPNPGTSIENETFTIGTCSKDQLSNANDKNNAISKRKVATKIDDGCRPQVSVLMAKHRRINELKRMNRLSLTKDKIKSNYTTNNSEKLPYSNKKDNGQSKDIEMSNRTAKHLKTISISQTDHSYDVRRKLRESINGSKGDGRKSGVSNASNVIPDLKPCTVRLELINDCYIHQLCKKHGVKLSNFISNQLRSICHGNEKLSTLQAQEEVLTKQYSHNQSFIKFGNCKFDDQISEGGSKGSDVVNDGTFNSSFSQESVTSKSLIDSRNDNWSLIKDNSFSDVRFSESKRSVLSLKLSSNKFNARKKDNIESSLKSPKSQKGKTTSGRNCYWPLNVVFQKSPVKPKNDRKHKDLPILNPTSAAKSTDLVEKGEVGKHEAFDFQESEIQTANISGSKINLEDMIEEIDEMKHLRYKPLKVGSSNPPLPGGSSVIEKESKNQHVSQYPLSSECMSIETSGDQDGIGKKAVRKCLVFSDDILCNMQQNDEADGAKFLDTSSSESEDRCQSTSKQSISESSCDEDGLGIVSFCEEDVFDSSFSSMSLAGKSFIRSQILSDIPLIVKRDSFNAVENEEKISNSENQDSSNVNTILSSIDNSLLGRSFSSNGNAVETEEPVEEDICMYNFEEACDDNGIEYAPLLKAPSWRVVAKYKNGREPKGLPFCSDPDDIPNKPIEVGELVLRLYSNRPNNLPPFENCLGSTGLEGHRKRMLENAFGGTDGLGSGSQWEKISKAALLPDAGTREIIVTPCKNPPKYKDVSQWVINRGYREALERTNEETLPNRKEKKFELIVGCPLDTDDHDECSEMVSLSPCSSLDSQEVTARAVINNKRVFSLQSTPNSLLKNPKQCNKTTNQSENCLEFSPIQAENEEDIIMCTPPSFPVAERSYNKKEVKTKSDKISWRRRRLIQDSNGRQNLLEAIKEERVNTPVKKVKSVHKCEGETCVPTNPTICIEYEHNLQNHLQQRNNQHLVGLGGSGHSSCQIEGISPNNTFGFQHSLNNLQDAKAIQKPEYITVMALEVQVRTRGDFRPDPEYDPIQAIFYTVVEDGGRQMEGDKNSETGVLLIDTSSKNNSQLLRSSGVALKALQVTCDEPSLFKTLGELMKKWDPDILAGYEVEMNSWGYVLERGSHLGLDVKSLLSRIPICTASEGFYRERGNEPFEMDSRRSKGYEDYDSFHLPGRIVLNVWRLMRSEAALMSYTFENVMYHLLHERVPLHSFKSLNDWWEHRTHLYRWITVEHWVIRVEGVMRLLVQLDLIGRTSELARLFGIQFYEVFSRGSQFRVESMMLRLAKPLNYVCVSPSSKQRSSMRAPEQLPLIMEPESRFFADPVIVLDFQSLYPSIIIAYNYCYSTCLGRVKHLGQAGPFEFGCTNLMVPPDEIAKLISKKKQSSTGNNSNTRSLISFSPCGVAFLGKEVRQGVLPRMLSEILETRLMVKKALKENKGNRVVERVLNSRQLGLKLIANVTYGYTSANFSGRMPCIEVGDSVVSKGRETLERAIALVHEKWGSQGVRVVYGDTDSLFVLAKGYSQAEAFKLGAQIVELVTENNPSPVKLKLEKVFQPCLLQTKKRYVGYAYETSDQEKPIFEAKGIETVRRDGCPAVAKVLEKSLRLLFDTRDVSLVKLHVQRQLGKLLSGRLSLQELTFAREYRGAAGYRPGACVPALQLARRWVRMDRRAEPRAGERVPYVIVSGPPGLPLFQLVRSPAELLMFGKQASTSSAQSQMHVNAHYYITRVLVPPLQRCFSLIGVDVESWYADMPRKFRSIIQPPPLSGPALVNVDTKMSNNNKEAHTVTSVGPKRSTIAEYFATSDCLSCGLQLDAGTQAALCTSCLENPQRSVFILAGRSNSWERAFYLLSKVCQSCCQRMEPIDCISLDCPVLYRRHQAMLEMEQGITLRVIINKLP